jgi:hypothetical protein
MIQTQQTAILLYLTTDCKTINYINFIYSEPVGSLVAGIWIRGKLDRCSSNSQVIVIRSGWMGQLGNIGM